MYCRGALSMCSGNFTRTSSQYTYWDYFRNAFENNWGWRIDHILATAPLAATCRKASIDLEPRKAKGSSDHTIIWADFIR